MDVDFIRFQFEDGLYGVITKNRFRIGIRHVQMVYMFVNSIAMGIVRGSMGVAVMALNDHTRRTDTYIKVYNWDGKIQGAILSSFFIGYAVTLVPSERVLKNVSGRMLTTAVLLINGLICVAMPTIVNKGGWIAVCNAKLLMGMANACFYTINHSQLAIWLPPSEKKFFDYLIYSGIQIGIVIALPVAGLISTAALGWELVYYSLGIVGLSTAVISGTLTASTPEDHQAIGDSEKEFIQKNLEYYRKKDLHIPWRDILKSSNIWAVICAHAASNTLFIFYIAYAPAYLMTFGETLKDSSWYCMLPFIAMTTVYMITQPITDSIYSIKYFSYIFSPSLFRKAINFVGAFGIVLGLTTLQNFSHEWVGPVIILLTAILGLQGFQFCGFLSSFRDMSENYAGSIMMLSSTFSSIFSGCMLFLFGLILGDNMTDAWHWRLIFFTLAGVYIICNIVYTLLGCNDRQYWDHINDRNRITTMDINQAQTHENKYMTYVSHKNEMDTTL